VASVANRQWSAPVTTDSRAPERLKSALPATLRGVLGGYRNRYAALSDAVTETEPTFDEALLAQMPVVDLLCEPINALADRWRDGAHERG
jgi:hypothetical protein